MYIWAMNLWYTFSYLCNFFVNNLKSGTSMSKECGCTPMCQKRCIELFRWSIKVFIYFSMPIQQIQHEILPLYTPRATQKFYDFDWSRALNAGFSLVWASEERERQNQDSRGQNLHWWRCSDWEQLSREHSDSTQRLLRERIGAHPRPLDMLNLF